MTPSRSAPASPPPLLHPRPTAVPASPSPPALLEALYCCLAIDEPSLPGAASSQLLCLPLGQSFHPGAWLHRPLIERVQASLFVHAQVITVWYFDVTSYSLSEDHMELVVDKDMSIDDLRERCEDKMASMFPIKLVHNADRWCGQRSQCR